MKVLVIGGGMAGLTYAIMSARQGNKVIVAERNSRVGRKVAMSGNGRCNIGNLTVTPDCYNDSALVRHVLDAVPVDQYLSFLRSAGVYTYADDCGRLYPVTDSASTVVDCLRFEAVRAGVEILVDCPVVDRTKVGDKYVVDAGGQKLTVDRLVVACGSHSQADDPMTANLVGGKQYLTALCPSLVPVRLTDADGTLNGVRNRAKVTLFCDGVAVAERSGEVQFKDYGLSGVCVFDLSAVIARGIVKGENHGYKFVVDLLPDFDEQTVKQIVQNNIDSGRDGLVGLVKNRVADYVKKKISATDNRFAERAAHLLKHMAFTFEKLLDYSMSQVTAGGVRVDCLSLPTLTLPDGVVVLGEALDVDGFCGGYNLYFAGASALSLFK